MCVAENGLFFLETSAKTAANVNELFTDIARRYEYVRGCCSFSGSRAPFAASDVLAQPSDNSCVQRLPRLLGHI
jgi:hypothetical protein